MLACHSADRVFPRLTLTLPSTCQNDVDLAKEVQINDHLLTLPELEQKFQTSLQGGLSQNEADFRLQRDGPNAFSPPKVTPAWVILLKELTLGFASIMWLAVILSLIVYGLEQVPQDVSGKGPFSLCPN